MRSRQALKIVIRRICNWKYKKGTYEKALQVLKDKPGKYEYFRSLALQMDVEDAIDRIMSGRMNFVTESIYFRGEQLYLRPRIK